MMGGKVVGDPERQGLTYILTYADIGATRFTNDIVTGDFVATCEDYPYGIGGGTESGMLGGFILLTRPYGVPAATVAEMKRLRPIEIVILGGRGEINTVVDQ